MEFLALVYMSCFFQTVTAEAPVPDIHFMKMYDENYKVFTSFFFFFSGTTAEVPGAGPFLRRVTQSLHWSPCLKWAMHFVICREVYDCISQMCSWLANKVFPMNMLIY